MPRSRVAPRTARIDHRVPFGSIKLCRMTWDNMVQDMAYKNTWYENLVRFDLNVHGTDVLLIEQRGLCVQP